MKKSAGQNTLRPSASQEDISQRAQQLWEGYGRPAGRDKEIWLEAERQLLGVDPLVEGVGGVSVSAANYDESIKQEKPRSRLPKPKPKPLTLTPAVGPTPVKKSAKAEPAAKPLLKPAPKAKTAATPVVSPTKKSTVKKTARTKR
jgi:hypothetical protein